MTKAACIDEETKKAITGAYHAGIMEGERRSSNLISLLQITNSKLWAELVRLDREEPLEGICISFEFAEIIIRALRTGQRHVKYANMLRRQVNQTDRTLNTLLDEMKNLLTS